MKFKVTKLKGKDLKPGDLFSNTGEIYWGEHNKNRQLAIGEKVYIRTDVLLPKPEKLSEVYKIEPIINANEKELLK